MNLCYDRKCSSRHIYRKNIDMQREKNKQIPFDKSKKVTHIEQRGRTKKRLPMGTVLFGILGVISILYCIGIAAAGFGTYFFLVWGLIGVLSLLLAALLANRELVARLPVWLKIIAMVLFCLGLVLFGTVEGMILTQFHASPEPGADYVILLGAQWKPHGPSEVLRRRLDSAAKYLEQNPDTAVIVSGGQGSNEPISEAAGMRQYLVDIGIDEERILMEDRSTNTMENLVFSSNLLDKQNDRVVIVTNNFHVFRAMQIARKQGYAKVEGLAASSVASFLPNNMLREFVGVLKDFLMGNM